MCDKKKTIRTRAGPQLKWCDVVATTWSFWVYEKNIIMWEVVGV